MDTEFQENLKKVIKNEPRGGLLGLVAYPKQMLVLEQKIHQLLGHPTILAQLYMRFYLLCEYQLRLFPH